MKEICQARIILAFTMAKSYQLSRLSGVIAINLDASGRRRRNNRQKNDYIVDEGTANVFANRNDMVYMDHHGREFEVLTVDFLKRYIYYAKDLYYKEKEATEGWKPYPEISDEARHSIVCLYNQLRQRASEYELKHKRLPQAVSPRTLEAIIRLSTAHARLKLNRWVTEEDVRYSKKLLNYTLFGEAWDISDDEGYSSDSDFIENLSDIDSAKRDRSGIRLTGREHEDEQLIEGVGHLTLTRVSDSAITGTVVGDMPRNDSTKFAGELRCAITNAVFQTR